MTFEKIGCPKCGSRNVCARADVHVCIDAKYMDIIPEGDLELDDIIPAWGSCKECEYSGKFKEFCQRKEPAPCSS